MRIRMKAQVSGTRNGADWPARGEEMDVTDAEGAAYCAAGMAEPVRADDVETATVPADGITTADVPAAAKRQPAKRGPGRPRAAK